MSTAAKGARNEHKSKAILEDAGFDVTRSAASKGLWDLVAIGVLGTILVQVKTRDWPGIAEMEALELFREGPHCLKLVHRWRDGEKRPDVKVVT